MLTLLVAQAFASEQLVLDRVAEVAALRSMANEKVPKVPDSAYRKAANGQVATWLQQVEGYKAKKAFGVGIVDVDISSFWAAINDEHSKVDNTKLAYLQVLSGSSCGDRRTVFQYLPVGVPFVSDRWWVVEQRKNTKVQEASEGRVREMSWATDENTQPAGNASSWARKGTPIAFTTGSWWLVDLDGARTLVEYYVWSDPGGTLPAGIASSFAAGGISDTFEDMTRLARKGPNCSKE